jgi:hypothetical protein
MSRYARIAITLPKSALTDADRLARSQDRSRSWVFAEAIRRLSALAKVGTDPGSGEGAPAMQKFSPGLGDSRLAQLRRDHALTPEERVRAADETLRLTERTSGPVVHHVTMFDRFQDYVDWKRARDRG